MNKETWIYSKRKNQYVKATKWNLFWRSIKRRFTKWKLVDTSEYCLIPWDNRKKQFTLSDKEYEESKKLYKEKGTISYEFYPCDGIGWGVKVRVLKTDEIIDITDYDNW